MDEWLAIWKWENFENILNCLCWSSYNQAFLKPRDDNYGKSMQMQFIVIESVRGRTAKDYFGWWWTVWV